NAVSSDFAKEIAIWLADHALPTVGEFGYWRNQLVSRLCILPENAYHDFLQNATEIQTHIKLEPDTKTVDKNLWVSESLPSECLLYSTVMASDSRSQSTDMTASEILGTLAKPTPGEGYREFTHIQLSGDETTGQGICVL